MSWFSEPQYGTSAASTCAIASSAISVGKTWKFGIACWQIGEGRRVVGHPTLSRTVGRPKKLLIESVWLLNL
jgi:hypothetical protein